MQLPGYITQFTHHPAMAKISHRLAIVSISLTGLVTLMAVSWARRGYIVPALEWWGYPIVPEPAAYLLTVPLAFFIWLYAAESNRPFQRRFSLPACLLSLAGFTAAAGFMAPNKVNMAQYYVN